MKVQQALDELRQQVDELAALVGEGEPAPGSKVEEIRLLARIVAARQALALAASLIDAHPHEVTGPIMDRIKALAEQVSEWREEGAGWFEERFVTRDKLRIGKNPDTGETEMWTEPRTYGPYYYYRWRDDAGKLCTVYYGRTDPRSEPAVVVGTDTTEEEPEEELEASPLRAVYSGKSTKAHLTIDRETALCGLALVDPATSLSFQADGCQRCRKIAQAQGLPIPGE